MVDLRQLVCLRAARDLLDRSYAEPVDLAAVAGRVGYSRFHFLRAFRSVYGQTPGRYLTRRRVERAKDLLRGANLSVTEICHLVGFTSLGSFSVRFKALVGVSPQAYRDEYGRRYGPAPVPGCYVLMWSGSSLPEGLRLPGTATTEKRRTG